MYKVVGGDLTTECLLDFIWSHIAGVYFRLNAGSVVRFHLHFTFTSCPFDTRFIRVTINTKRMRELYGDPV